ncbi:type I restriction endonuclease subunit R [Candidatus Xianfuyuplasma coldseepsis]|uniref:Type I restriction enzyme endonuclease subunit n=1 Tax=Candidatus Xianfuyuplasma coldseepsis TaxID=2782163 RepID=A0A7L7KQ73_9MOLU|nr:type I restriction endonuclease subunit R [Xianfuyuplasma coldseepsis]QMS84837.1 type I restriction endonuclease subunit R [Xianfuyuplasma coldseepsis]
MGVKVFYESDVEEAALQWLEELGYNIEFGPNISFDGEYPERDSYEEVILIERLREALLRINDTVPRQVIEDAIREITIPKQVSLIANNHAFHKMINEGVTVLHKEEDGSTVYPNIQLFDFENIENNDFLAVNQFTVVENRVEKRPDIVLFVNGLPLVVFELKTPSDEKVTVHHAYRQIKNYQKSISNLFVYNAFNVISDGHVAKAGTITSNEEWYMSWRTIDGINIAPKVLPQLETLLKGMFRKDIFMDIIKQFILFQENNNDYNKILAGYHQYHAVNTALESTYTATSEDGDRRIGVIWHTQGSGKSLSMVFYAGKMVISQELSNPTIVVITDRNDLDDQLFSTFSKSKDLLRSYPQQAESRDHLKELLDGRDSGGIIFTTIHKFAPNEEGLVTPLTERKNVIVMADEAHRSQYGFKAEVVKTKEEAYEKYGYAKHMRDSLPNASYIGFTGTPIETTDKNTRAVFGDYIDVYDMTRAVEDGTTVKIYYESRIARIDFTEEYELIDENYDDITEYQEDVQKEGLKRKWARLEAIVGAEPRIKVVAKDLVEHFEKRQASMETEVGKGMIVAMSRRIAVELHDAIIALRPDWLSDELMKGKIKVVMTGSSSDPEHWQTHIGNKQTRDTLSRRMKDNDDELQLVIVRDMWLTGFDVPSLHTMYVDKPMQGHNLMQAIARVNRVFKEKQGGLIVDYIGIAESLKKALSQYTDSDREQTGVDTELAVSVMMEKLELVRELLHGFDYSLYFKGRQTDKLKIIMATIDYIVGLSIKRKEDYIKLTSELTKAYSLCATTETAEKHNVEIGFYKSVRAGIIKLTTDNNKKKSRDQLDRELNQLISKSLKSDKVIDIMSEIGLAKPDISILSDEFLEEFKNMDHKNVAVELLKRLIQGKIRAFSRKTVVQSRLFSEMLEDSLAKYHKRLIDSTIVIEELIALAKDITKAAEAGKESGLTEDEYAFYQALASNIKAQEVMGIDVLKDIAKELTVKIKASTTVDWNIRDSVRAKMRFEIKVLLKKYKYPPDDPTDPNNYDRSVKLIMEQTELVCENEVQYGL